MTGNETIGLITPEQKKEKLELEKKLDNRRIDFDFYSNGMSFIGVQPHSANHLFGNARWKKAIREKLGEEKLKQFAEYYGNKPIDFKLAGLHIEPKNSAYFNTFEYISVKAADGGEKYNGTYQILEKGKDFVLIMKEYLGEASGALINESRKKGAERKINDLKKQLSGFISQPPFTPEPPVEEKKDETVPPAEEPKTEKKDNTMKVLKTVGVVLLIAGLAYGGYKLYEWQNKQAA